MVKCDRSWNQKPFRKGFLNDQIYRSKDQKQFKKGFYNDQMLQLQGLSRIV